MCVCGGGYRKTIIASKSRGVHYGIKMFFLSNFDKFVVDNE